MNGIGREKRYAVIQHGKVEKLVIEQPKQQSIVGRIYYGIVEKVLPGMNAAFVNIGLDKNGFIHRDKLPAFVATKVNKSISSYLHQGEKLLVQVEKDATGDKGPRLTGILEFGGQMLVYMPNGHSISVSKRIDEPEEREKWRQFGVEQKKADEGILFRTSCKGQETEFAYKELEQHRTAYDKVLQESKTMKKPGLVLERNTFLESIKELISGMNSGEVIIDNLEMKKELDHLNRQFELFYHNKRENIFTAYGVEHEFEKALQKEVWLENGAYLIFDEAEALTIIDVNTGKFSGKSELRQTVLKTNEKAAEEIARQIRLRDLAGMILIDFIDMKDDSERERVKRKLENALRLDDRRTRIVGFTSLGILQLTRTKTRVSIEEALTTDCQTCAGSGKVLSPETIAFRLERELLELRGSDEEAVLIETSEEVKDLFLGESGVHLNRLEEMIGLDIYFSIKDAAKPYYFVRQIGSSNSIKASLSK